MEWLLLLLVAAAAAAYVGWPRGVLELADGSEADGLHNRRATLLDELAEFDADLEMGRISEDERRSGRRAIAPELRTVTERLRDLDEPLEVQS